MLISRHVIDVHGVFSGVPGRVFGLLPDSMPVRISRQRPRRSFLEAPGRSCVEIPASVMRRRRARKIAS